MHGVYVCRIHGVYVCVCVRCVYFSSAKSVPNQLVPGSGPE